MVTGMKDGWQQLLSDLQDLRAASAEVSALPLHPTLEAEVIESFEADFNLRLPEDYRDFLMNVSGGGLGPGYGIFELQMMDDGHGLMEWQQGDGFVGILANPFPYSGDWNDLSEMPDPDFEDELWEDFERRYEEFEKRL